MDYIIENLTKSGFKPESRREQAFVENLKDNGFVFFDKANNVFKFKEEVEKSETTDEITLSIKPKLNYLGLFPKVDNFSTDLISPRVRHIMLEFLANSNNPMEVLDRKIKGFKLGSEYSLTAVGFGKNENNEGYKFEVPEELVPLMYKGNKFCFFTTGLSKSGKEKDTKNIDFVGVRPVRVLFRLGISTSFGVFYDLDEYKKSGNTLVLDKATLK